MDTVYDIMAGVVPWTVGFALLSVLIWKAGYGTRFSLLPLLDRLLLAAITVVPPSILLLGVLFAQRNPHAPKIAGSDVAMALCVGFVLVQIFCLVFIGARTLTRIGWRAPLMILVSVLDVFLTIGMLIGAGEGIGGASL